MNRHGLVLGMLSTVIASAIAPLSASAATLSSDAAKLLKLDPNSSQYASQYTTLKNNYNNQATAHSLDFESWFAMNAFINNESAAYGSNGAKLNTLTALDTSKLTWQAGAHGVEVFFINEGAGYRNKLGYSFADPTVATRDGMKAFWDNSVNVIWGDVSSQNSILPNSNGPLALGQGAKLSNVSAGQTLNFFIRNGSNGMGDVFDALGVNATKNADKLQHVTTYQYQDLLVLAFEDLYNGGDKDYNDVVFAVRGLTDTQLPSAAVPEPTSALVLLGLGVAGLVISRKSDELSSESDTQTTFH